jgi:hypothetical protein
MDFELRRSDLHETRFLFGDAPSPADGEALLRVESFGLTSNNITYAVFGEAMKYWNFFPIDRCIAACQVWSRRLPRSAARSWNCGIRFAHSCPRRCPGGHSNPAVALGRRQRSAMSDSELYSAAAKLFATHIRWPDVGEAAASGWAPHLWKALQQAGFSDVPIAAGSARPWSRAVPTPCIQPSSAGRR